jgi:hypothetical protein
LISSRIDSQAERLMKRVSVGLLDIPRFIGLLAALQVGLAIAEPESWMKKTHPNELALMLTVNEECPIPVAQFERFVMRSFHRLWVRRTRIDATEPFLRIEVWCQRGTLTPFTMVAQFVRFDQSYDDMRVLGPSYEVAGSSAHYRIRELAGQLADRALEDHIAANFDL